MLAAPAWLDIASVTVNSFGAVYLTDNDSVRKAAPQDVIQVRQYSAVVGLCRCFRSGTLAVRWPESWQMEQAVW